MDEAESSWESQAIIKYEECLRRERGAMYAKLKPEREMCRVTCALEWRNWENDWESWDGLFIIANIHEDRE